jgi:hypothetical protein
MEPTKDQPNETLGAPRRSVEERSAIPISQKLLIGLRIQPRQILLAPSLDRIFAGQDITRPQPVRERCIIVWMSGIDWHVFSFLFAVSADCSTGFPSPIFLRFGRYVTSQLSLSVSVTDCNFPQKNPVDAFLILPASDS